MNKHQWRWKMAERLAKTVGELAETFAHIARTVDEDMEVYLRHDGGYTYGGITSWYLEVEEIEEDE